MFEKFNFQPTEDGYYQLVCPICGRVDEAKISGTLVSILSWSHKDSVCIYCDESADKRIPYTLPDDGGGHTALTDNSKAADSPEGLSIAFYVLVRKMTRQERGRVLDLLRGTCRITQSSAASGLARNPQEKAICRVSRSQKTKQ